MRAEFPLPDLAEPLTGAFWRHAQDGVLAIPQTADGRWHWYPKTEDVTWVPVSGRGTVFSFSEVHQTFLPHYADDLPFVVGLVELEESAEVRLATRFTAPVEIGHPVVVDFRPLRFAGVEGEVLAPFFSPR